MARFPKSSYLIALASLATGYFAGHTTSETASQTAFPMPISEVFIERDSYTLAYDGRHKQARWVYENLTAERANGNAMRKNYPFKEDPLVPEPLRSTPQDYAGSGFDRGHLCPAADAKLSDAFMQETFYLSNISPQCPEFNRGFWAKMEKHVRALATQYQSVHVFTGGLYLPSKEKLVKYQVIGDNYVAVPTHFFKVIFGQDRTLLEAYILPNSPIAASTPLQNFSATLDQVERSAGIFFLKNAL